MDAKLDAAYQQQCAARHWGSHASVIFTRDNVPGQLLGWHASLCFVGVDEYLPWDDQTADQWLRELYGADRPHVISYGSQSTLGALKGVRHFMLEVDGW